MLCVAVILRMETRRPAKRAAPGCDDSRQPHVHSTHRNSAITTTQGQRQGRSQGPWKRYQLKIDDGYPTLPAKDDDEYGTTKRSTLDPATRAGCVPATAYPSFRTIPPPPAVVPPPPAVVPRPPSVLPPPPADVSYRRRLPRVSRLCYACFLKIPAPRRLCFRKCLCLCAFVQNISKSYARILTIISRNYARALRKMD